jgi:RNase P subunit RPR2
MVAEEKRKKKKKGKKKQKHKLVLLAEEEIVSETFPELLKLLEELEKEGKFVDIQICPRCKSARIKRIRTMEGDMSSHLTITPIKYECLDCGWKERLVLKATNRPLGLKEMALIAEALDFKEKKE